MKSPLTTRDSLQKAREKALKKTGRPTKFNDNIAVEILMKLEQGDTLTAICKLPGMPHISTIYEWRDGVPAFSEAFTRARLIQGNALAHEGVEILDYQRTDSMIAVRLAEMRAKYRLELAKCYDRETYGQNVKVSQTLSVESMDQRIKRLTGMPVTLPAEFMYLVEK